MASLEWTINAYTLSYAVLLLTGAELGDPLGRKRIFVAGLALFTVASAMAASAPTIDTLIAARVLQGVGGGLATPLTLTLLSAAVPPERRGLALGVWGAVSGCAVAIGPVVGASHPGSQERDARHRRRPGAAAARPGGARYTAGGRRPRLQKGPESWTLRSSSSVTRVSVRRRKTWWSSAVCRRP